MVDVVFVSIGLAPSMLHHNNVRVTYPKTSNFKLELVRSIPLYYVTMLQSTVTITKAPIITVPAQTIISMRSKP
jgi:hypothetical protein